MLKRLIPSSLLGQVMAVLALGLLIAQVISATLLYQASEQRRDASLVNSLAFRVVGEASRPVVNEERRQMREARRLRREANRPPPIDGKQIGPRVRLGIERTNASPVKAGEARIANYESALREILERQDVEVGQIAITRRIAANDPYVAQVVKKRPRLLQSDWEGRQVLVAAIERADQSGWTTIRVVEPRRPALGPAMILLQTLVIFAVLVQLLYLVLRRITRPLAQLTNRVTDFAKAPGKVVELEESGPSDTRRLIAAHNTMEARIAALLDEKDVMLGAIGHDLKTPLAALRVRIESVSDETQRLRMAESIEDITATLDDILSLARVGRSGAAPEAADIGALAMSVAEEFEDLGQAVSITDPPRIVASIKVTWVKRALRNLTANAVRYGNSAEISVHKVNDEVILRVDDDGPGIEPDRIAEMLEPFARGEGSRNRATGGAGLGLALARAIAEEHGGTLILTNLGDKSNPSGLRAEIRLPMQ
ncbi:MAG: ATP-binding protein [Pseudomonadota bacterium]